MEITPLYLKQILIKQITETKKTYVRVYKDIIYQTGKVKKIWTVRRLIYTYWDKGLLDIIPIWLVSPETVSSVFPLVKGMFDIVIFDEASQCFVENGIPSFFRAKKVVVAGDEKQLNPFDLFKVGLDENEWDMLDEAEYAQSLLTLSKRYYSTSLLAWHYRSKYEELINFSNYAYYNGKVQIAPNVMSQMKTPVIEWKQVDGKWENQCNVKEAEKVCRILKELFIKYSQKSIGVITFNKKQQELILDLIEQFSEKDQVFKELVSINRVKDIDERLFIKNIENVQGDERDIIIFSIAYGRNENGKVTVNFGTLNKVGGENRLNVAVTRAKEKIVVVSSIKPEELEVSRSRNQGPKLFKKYLQYTYAVGNNQKDEVIRLLNGLNEEDVKISSNIRNKFESQFHEELYNKLTEKGYIIHTNVGCSGYKIDLAVVHPKETDRYLLGIECDGKMYYNARSVKEREIYRRRFLEDKGWKLIRVWSRNWWKNSGKELDKIEKQIKQIL